MVNIGPNETDITMHINPRFNAHGDENAVVCNSYQGGSWCEEVRQGGFPFKQGEEFKVGPPTETPLTAVKIGLATLACLAWKAGSISFNELICRRIKSFTQHVLMPPPTPPTSLSSRLSSPSLWRSSRWLYPTAPPSSSRTAWAQTSTPTSTWTATPASPALKSSESPEIFSQGALEWIFRESWCGFSFFLFFLWTSLFWKSFQHWGLTQPKLRFPKWWVACLGDSARCSFFVCRRKQPQKKEKKKDCWADEKFAVRNPCESCAAFSQSWG